MLRLPIDDHARISKAAKRRNQSRAAFVASAAMAACADVEEERRLRHQRKHGFTPDEDDNREPAPERSPGLGIRDALAKRETDDDDDRETPSAPAPVVVNVNGGGGGGSGGTTGVDLVERLAAFVVKGGPSYMRDMRRRQCENMLRASATDDGERRQFLTNLDEEVARRDAKRENSSAARFAIDKIKDFLR